MPGETALPAQQTVTTRDVVVLRLPADGSYLSVLRTATAGLASRLDFTIDDIEDLRIAVDEACAMLLSHAVPGADLTCEFELNEGVLRVAVSVQTSGRPERRSPGRFCPRSPARSTARPTLTTA
jgi:serine/threonine-protein kinase RsbW